MRTNLVHTLENKKLTLRKKKKFYDNLSLKHIPTFKVYMNHLLDNAQNRCNETSINIEEQIMEIDTIIDDLCCLQLSPV